ncbi:RDD family protein [Paenibacillus vulneris]|uniref:RDD family protein n=1 Tax=Paenibacillus vulneris TaxID=1133364 RepID=A0ABW3UP14_9BACL
MESPTNSDWTWNEGNNAAARPLEGRQYAGFWIRFAAVIIDGIALQIVFSILNVMLGYSAMEPPRAVSALESLLSCIYYVTMTVAWGQTLGKMAVGIEVVREDGRPNGVGWIILREVIGKFVSGLILCIGFMMAGWDREKRALHDRMAGTRVVKAAKR